MYFSIILPVYNAQNTIADTLSSLAEQEFQNFELIVINDGSSDNSLHIIQQFADKFQNFKLISLNNMGVAQARNAGLRACSGKFVAFIDADDLWHSQKLYKQYQHFIENPNCFLTYTDANIIDETGKLLSLRVSPPELKYETLLLYNSIVLSSAVVSAKLAKLIEFQAVGHEDYLFWLSALRAMDAPFVCSKTEYSVGLTSYRKHSNSLSSSKLKSARWHFSVLSKLEIPLLRRLYLFSRYAFNGVKLLISERAQNKRRIKK